MQIKVLSWNIWCGTHQDKVKEFLKNSDADIIALQEVAQDKRGNISKIIADELGYNFVYTTDIDLPLKYLPGYSSDNEGTVKMGNAILSKYEIISSKEHVLVKGKKRTVIEANIKVGNTILNIFSIHLRHTHQQQLELQDLQAESLLKLLPATHTIVMGDFNSLPESNVIKNISKSLINTEVGSSTPTWSVYKEGCTECLIGEVIHKLDYIFTTRDIKSNSFKVYNSDASDHLPVSVVLEL
ncbi:MAG: endonuclease/exonuclease/phosphatase family protein [Candidatus Pacebacteria bacterium]|nr:endonuclease/exonuclease/phosphatase family protein [Candidatus Paceibacterota bacterium]